MEQHNKLVSFAALSTRSLKEVSIIIVGILIALAADERWGNCLDRAEESEIRASIHEDAAAPLPHLHDHNRLNSYPRMRHHGDTHASASHEERHPGRWMPAGADATRTSCNAQARARGTRRPRWGEIPIVWNSPLVNVAAL